MGVHVSRQVVEWNVVWCGLWFTANVPQATHMRHDVSIQHSAFCYIMVSSVGGWMFSVFLLLVSTEFLYQIRFTSRTVCIGTLTQTAPIDNSESVANPVLAMSGQEAVAVFGGVETKVICIRYADRVFLTITQLPTFGTLVSARNVGAIDVFPDS